MARIGKIRTIVDAAHGVLHFELDGIESIDDALSLFNRAKPALIIINGGDGTVGAVLASIFYSGILDIVPPIAILPGGKTNMTAADLGSKGRPDKMLERLLKLVREGRLAESLTKRNLIEMDLGDGKRPQVGTFFGTAGVVRGIHWCREHAYSKNMPLFISHLYAMSRLFMSGFGLSRGENLLSSEDMKIYIRNGGRLEGKYASVLATTLDDLLFGLRPYGKEGSGGLRFSAVDVGGGNLFRALKGLITGSFGRKGIQGVQVRRSDEIRIEGNEPVTLDGEMFDPVEGKPITLRGDKALTFVKLP